MAARYFTDDPERGDASLWQDGVIYGDQHESLFEVGDDVRAAMGAVAGNERKSALAGEIGLAGARAARMWDERADQVGAQQAVAEASQLYRAQPKASGKAPREPQFRNDHEHLMDAARRAYATATEKAQTRADMPATMRELNAIEQRHGNLDVIERRKAWHQQLIADP